MVCNFSIYFFMFLFLFCCGKHKLIKLNKLTPTKHNRTKSSIHLCMFSLYLSLCSLQITNFFLSFNNQLLLHHYHIIKIIYWLYFGFFLYLFKGPRGETYIVCVILWSKKVFFLHLLIFLFHHFCSVSFFSYSFVLSMLWSN